MIRILAYSFFLIFLMVWLLPASSCSGAAASSQRIVSLGPINTENVFLLGAGDRLVGDTVYCVRPEAARNKAKIGSVMLVSIEKIIALKPDIILATAMTSSEQVRQLRDLGYRVVRFRQPKSFDGICRQFVSLGKLLGLAKRAVAIVRQAKAKVDKIRLRTSALPAQKVFLQVGTRPLFGAVPGSFINDFIILAGGQNVIADQARGTTQLEKVIEENPNVIIIAIMGSESGIAGDEKRTWQKFTIINAVRDNRVFIINPDLVCSPSPVTFVRTLAIIADMIHPSLKRSKK